MKKILTLLLLVLLSSSHCFAMTAEEEETYFNEQVTVMQEAYSNKNYEKAIKILINMYYAEKKDWLKKDNTSVDEINGLIASKISIVAMEAFDNTKSLKYYKIAKKYSTKAIKLKTNITEAVEVAMRCGVGVLDKDLLLNSYEYLCSLDKGKCEQYKNEVAESVASIEFAIQTKKEQRKEKAKSIARNTLLFTTVFAGALGQQMQQNERNYYNNYQFKPSNVDYSQYYNVPSSPYFRQKNMRENLYRDNYAY